MLRLSVEPLVGGGIILMIKIRVLTRIRLLRFYQCITYKLLVG